jgi:hypothetical protein
MRLKPVTATDMRRQQSNDNGVGIIFRSYGPDRTNAGQGAVDFYGFAIGPTPSPGATAISYVGAGQWGALEVSPPNRPINVGEWYTLKLVVEGNRFRGYVDDELVCDAQDDRFSGDYVGPYISLYMDTSFDDFMITDETDVVSAVHAEGKLLITWGRMKTER